MIYPKTIEDVLSSGEKNPLFTLSLLKDICKRIKKLEGRR